MSEEPTPYAAAPVAERAPAKKVSAAWIIPILALLLGAWLVLRHVSTQGPTAEIQFETADGIEAGKTQVKCRSVNVGKVESVELGEELRHVIVTIRMNGGNEDLLLPDTRFWVVRPRVGGGGVTGLGTIFSGAYIELDPGVVDEGDKDKELELFVGLEEPPATPQDVPGVRFDIIAEDAQSLGIGTPISYNGFEVGRIEESKFDQKDLRMVYRAFVRAPYSDLVTENVRFWNASGVNFQANTEGFSLRTGSVESIVRGGIAFGLPGNSRPGGKVADGTRFELFDNEDDIDEIVFKQPIDFLLMFDASVRGLSDKAPVEFRGIQVGEVKEISFEYIEDSDDRRVPVLIEIDPERFGNVTAGMTDGAREEIAIAIDQGLRATLRTGSLLTGQLYVDLDFTDELEPVREEFVGEIPTIPTQSSSLSRIEDRVMKVLDKIRELPVEKTLNSATDALTEMKGTAAAATVVAEDLQKSSLALEALLTSDEINSIPADVRLTLAETQRTLANVGPESQLFTDLARTLEDFQATLQSMKTLSDSIDNQPNSLIFGKEGTGRDPIPGSRR